MYEHIHQYLKAIDQAISDTMIITSRKTVLQGAQRPSFELMMVQLVANQVTILQSIKALIVLMVGPDEPPRK